jgi:hypothetical protein
MLNLPRAGGFTGGAWGLGILENLGIEIKAAGMRTHADGVRGGNHRSHPG